MAKTKNAPNAARVSLYVPAGNKFEDLVSWHEWRGLCKARGTSVFRELVKIIRKELRESPPTERERVLMEEEVKAQNLDSYRKAPLKDSGQTEDNISFG